LGQKDHIAKTTSTHAENLKNPISLENISSSYLSNSLESTVLLSSSFSLICLVNSLLYFSKFKQLKFIENDYSLCKSGISA